MYALVNENCPYVLGSVVTSSGGLEQTQDMAMIAMIDIIAMIALTAMIALISFIALIIYLIPLIAIIAPIALFCRNFIFCNTYYLETFHGLKLFIFCDI